MIKDIKIGDKDITLSANAGVAFVYKRIFRTDMLSDLAKMSKDEMNTVETVQRMAFVMAMMHELPIAECLNLTEIKYLEWLCDFEINAFSSADVIIEILNIWNNSEATTVTEKN